MTGLYLPEIALLTTKLNIKRKKKSSEQLKETFWSQSQSLPDSGGFHTDSDFIYSVRSGLKLCVITEDRLSPDGLKLCVFLLCCGLFEVLIVKKKRSVSFLWL